MKKIYRSATSLIGRICAIGLAIMGYGCENDADMYGTPTGHFEIKGTVTDEDGAKMRDAIIRVTGENFSSGELSFSTTTTEADGNYNSKGTSLGSNLKVVCLPADQAFEPDSTVVNVTYEKSGKKNKNPWYVGDATGTVNFKLKKKPDNK